MKVNELRQTKEDLERDIQAAIEELVARFEIETDIEVRSLSIAGASVPIRERFLEGDREVSEYLRTLASSNPLHKIKKFETKTYLDL